MMRFLTEWPRTERAAMIGSVLTLVLGLLTLVLISQCARAEGVRLVGGPARVIDGESIALLRVGIRLHGIDAPESGQQCARDGQLYTCGTVSTRALVDLAGHRQLVCEVRDVNRYTRLVAECWRMDSAGRREPGESVNARMARSAHAIAYRRYADAYNEHEREAREARRGLWSGEFAMPDEFRQAARKAAQ